MEGEARRLQAQIEGTEEEMRFLAGLVGLLLLATPAFAWFYDVEHEYPRHYNARCYDTFKVDHHYRHEVHYSLHDMPEVIPEEGWDAPLKSQAMCLDPTGAFVGLQDSDGVPYYKSKNTGEVVYIHKDQQTF